MSVPHRPTPLRSRVLQSVQKRWAVIGTPGLLTGLLIVVLDRPVLQAAILALAVTLLALGIVAYQAYHRHLRFMPSAPPPLFTDPGARPNR